MFPEDDYYVYEENGNVEQQRSREAMKLSIYGPIKVLSNHRHREALKLSMLAPRLPGGLPLHRHGLAKKRRTAQAKLLTLPRRSIGDLPPWACQGETTDTSHGKPQKHFW